MRLVTPLAAASFAFVLALTGLGAAPAGAQVLAVDDPTGDRGGRGLDVVRAVLDSRDSRLVVRVRFQRAVRGDLVVSVDPRGKRGVRLVSRHRPAGTTRSYVVDGAFGDRDRPDAGRVPCPGFRVRWGEERPVARLTLPSRCLRRGDYGAVRFTVLTERPRGGDVDSAPDRVGVSGWVPRG